MSEREWPERPSRPDGVPVVWGLDPDARRMPPDLKVGDRVTGVGGWEYVVESVNPLQLSGDNFGVLTWDVYGAADAPSVAPGESS